MQVRAEIGDEPKTSTGIFRTSCQEICLEPPIPFFNPGSDSATENYQLNEAALMLMPFCNEHLSTDIEQEIQINSRNRSDI